jgi:hypothetical protein
MIILTKETVQQIFEHILNFNSVKHDVNNWEIIYENVVSQTLTTEEVHKIAQYISQSNMNTDNVVTGEDILNNVKQCKTREWQKQRMNFIQNCSYLK